MRFHAECLIKAKESVLSRIVVSIPISTSKEIISNMAMLMIRPLTQRVNGSTIMNQL